MINHNIHEQWMYYALKEAKIAEKNEEVPIGAIVIKDDKIVGRGSNQVESLKDSTAHAEIIAITSASNTLNDWRLNNCILYVTKQPCLMCLGSILNSRIEQLYYGMHDSEAGTNTNILELTDKKHLKYIQGGVLLNECKEILQKFFLKRR